MDFIDDEVLADLMEQVNVEMQKLEDAARKLAKQSTFTVEEAAMAILNVLYGYAEPGEKLRTLNRLDVAAIRERKEAREKIRAAERENASRFRQYKARETARATQKRNGQRRREWCGPWRAKNRTN